MSMFLFPIAFVKTKILYCYLKWTAEHLVVYITTMSAPLPPPKPTPHSVGPNIWLLLVKSSFQANNLHFES